MGHYQGFIKGIATGMVMGSAITLMVEPSRKDKQKLQKKAEGVFRSIGSMIDTAIGMRK